MSYMNHLEKKMRYSNAFSSLNSLRNKLEFDGSSIMDSDEKEIILDAIEIATEPTEQSFKKALLYGFYNTGDSIKSSALELAKVIFESLKGNYLNQNDIEEFKKVLRSADITLSDNRPNLISKIDSLMMLLNKARQEDVPPTSKLLIRGLI